MEKPVKVRKARKTRSGHSIDELTELLTWYRELENPLFAEDIQLIEQDIKDGGQRFYSYIMATHSHYGD